MESEKHLELELKRHRHRVRAMTTFMVMGALCVSFIPHEYTTFTFIANAAANLFWIWAE